MNTDMTDYHNTEDIDEEYGYYCDPELFVTNVPIYIPPDLCTRDTLSNDYNNYTYTPNNPIICPIICPTNRGVTLPTTYTSARPPIVYTYLNIFSKLIVRSFSGLSDYIYAVSYTKLYNKFRGLRF
jgi:hypothetical protein